MRERGREGGTDRQTDRKTERERERERLETETERLRERERERERMIAKAKTVWRRLVERLEQVLQPRRERANALDVSKGCWSENCSALGEGGGVGDDDDVLCWRSWKSIELAQRLIELQATAHLKLSRHWCLQEGKLGETNW